MKLIDPYNRKIDYLRISITDRCNLRCIYCMPWGVPRCAEKSELLTARTLLSFIKTARNYGLKKVRLTGGEPLLREDVLELVRGIKELGVEDLSLTTNGLLLDEKAPALKRAGLDRVNVSLDSMRPERLRALTGGGDVAKVFEAISRAEELGLAPVKINMVPIRGLNEDEILSFARLTLVKPYHVRFLELMPFRNSPWKRDRLVKAHEAKALISSNLGRLKWKGQEGSSKNFALDGALGTLGFISPESDHFCSRCNRLRITAKGKLRPCLFSTEELEIKNSYSEEELEQILLEAVRRKPAGKKEATSLPFEAMSQIGG